MLTIKGIINIEGDLNLTGLSRGLAQANPNKELFKAALEKKQQELVTELCGERYERSKNRKYKRAGTRKRTLITMHGNIEFKLFRVKSFENKSTFIPLFTELGIPARKRVVEDSVFEYAETATRLSYKDSKKVIETLTHATVSKYRVHKNVQDVGKFIEKERKATKQKNVDFIESDATKAHGLGKKNEINVVMGKNRKTGQKSLLALTVNESWKETAKQSREARTGKTPQLISDADPEMRCAMIEKGMDYQLGVRHGIGIVSYSLWQAKVPKDERKEIIAKLTTILMTCRNSTRKHLKDKNFRRLQWRINQTLKELKELAKEMKNNDLTGVAKFITNSANYLVTFARLAMKSIVIPYTNNLIERLMGEVAKRIKHKWMHWSTTGLENILNILLLRYCNNGFFNEIREKFNKNNEPIPIQVTVT